jgi:hypothetical protein
VLAGDFNIGTQVFSPAERAGAEAAAAGFARLRARHLTDCIAPTRKDR